MEAPEGGAQLAGRAGDPLLVVRLWTMSQLAPFLHDPFLEKKGQTVPGGFAAPLAAALGFALAFVLVRASSGRGGCSLRSGLSSGLETLDLLLSLG